MSKAKRSFGRLLVLAPVAIAANAQAQDYVQTVLNTDPVAYWRMDAVNENDIVNGYSTSYSGDTTVTAPGGGIALGDDPTNRAGLFDGTGFITTGMSSQQTFGNAATIMAWVYMAELPSTAGRIFYVAGKSDNGNDLDLQIQTDNQLYFYTDSGGHTNTTTALAAGQWYQVVGTFDNTTHVRDLYVDGALVGTTSSIATHSADNNGFNIGASLVFGGRNFDGSIDEVAAWNYALSGAQVLSIYDSAPNTPEPCTMAVLGLGGLGVLARRRRPA